MNDWPDYELLDFGAGRKLERFGPWLLDRPCPAAFGASRGRPAEWTRATARFEGERAADGEWSPPAEKWPQRELSLSVPLSDATALTLLLEPLPSGQVGVFPEQWRSWLWIAEQCRRARGRTDGKATPGQSPGLRVLNLFAYTGGSTLAAAVAGAEVVHVDAARSVVERARQNAAAVVPGESSHSVDR